MSNETYRLNESSIYEDSSYLANNPDWHVGDAPWKADNIAQILKRNRIAPRYVAEVGCGAGEILVQLDQRIPNCSFSGFELSPQAFEMSRTRESNSIHFFNQNIFEKPDTYDVVLCIDVFEHVDDYLGFTKALKPLSEYKIFHIPLDLSVQAVGRKSALMGARERVGHLHYFTKETALATVQYCGYEIVDHFLTGLALDAPNRGLRANLMKLPRRLLSMVSTDFAARVLGGWSLLVLAK